MVRWVGDRRIVELLVDVDEDGVVFDLARVDGYGGDRGTSRASPVLG